MGARGLKPAPAPAGSLPPLHVVEQAARDGRCRGPHETCHWVLPGRRLAGSYPGAAQEPEHSAKLRACLDAGVDMFVCLMPTDELRRFRPHAADTRALAAGRGRRVALLHCCRTGTVVSIVVSIALARLYAVPADAAVRLFRATHAQRRAARGRFPHSLAQLRQVQRLGGEARGAGAGADWSLRGNGGTCRRGGRALRASPAGGRTGPEPRRGFGWDESTGGGVTEEEGAAGGGRPPQQPAQPPVRQLLGSAAAATTPQGTQAAAADRTRRLDATCEGKNG